MRKSRKCGNSPWHNRWHQKQNNKEPRYFCLNCDNLFYTGKFWRNDSDLYDDVCPNCGAMAESLGTLSKEFMDLCREYDNLTKQHKIMDGKDKTLEWLVDSIIKWATEREIDNPILQYAKVNEEIGEIAHELTRSRRNSIELIDALGDSFVALIILTDTLGYDVKGVILAAYEVIKDRKGKTVSGSFIKDEK